MVRKEGASAAIHGELLENVVATCFLIFAVETLGGIGFLVGDDPVDAGADGVNDDSSALGHVHGFAARMAAQVIVAVTDDHEDAAHVGNRGCRRYRRRRTKEFLAALIDRVIERGAACSAL